MTAALQKAAIKRAAKAAGMRVFRGFLIGSRTKDVVSGLVIDAPPSGTYLWTFVLPMYDGLSFLHMSLGDRVVACGKEENRFSEAYDIYRRQLAGVESPRDLIEYIDRKEVLGEYAHWAKYLSLIRLGDYAAADRALEAVLDGGTSKGVEERLEEIGHARSNGGWPAVQQLLDEWTVSTGRLLGD